MTQPHKVLKGRSLILDKDLPSLFYLGPHLDEGPLPAIFYFALSGNESLCLDPFNQPVITWLNYKVRVFSWTLPFHEGQYPHKGAMEHWAERLAQDREAHASFLHRISLSISKLVSEKIADGARLAVAGLSRGGWIATHLAARDKRLSHLLCFAPLVRFETTHDFVSSPLLPSLHPFGLHTCVANLLKTPLRIYVGNHDRRISTRACFDFIELLAKTSWEHHKTYPPAELLIAPSVGHLGHGTPPHAFSDGAHWLARQLSLNSHGDASP